MDRELHNDVAGQSPAEQSPAGQTPTEQTQTDQAPGGRHSTTRQDRKPGLRPRGSNDRGRNRWWLRIVIQSAVVLATGYLLLVGVGVAQRIGWISTGGGGDGDETNAAAGSGVVYVCPMMCTPTRTTKPSNCPVCGMKTAPVPEGGSQDELAVSFEPVARRLAGIQTAVVQRDSLKRSITTVGKISFDESRRATISAYVSGRIEKLFVDYTGDDVSAGESLATVYSPDLYAAQVEYLVSLPTSKLTSRTARLASGTVPSPNDRSQLGSMNNVEPGPKRVESAAAFIDRFSANIAASAKEKLLELGMTSEQVAQLERNKQAETRLRIGAPISGTVIEKLRDEGDYVRTGDPIYRIADLSVVWLLLELFPDDAAQIRYGQQVEAVVQSLPDEVFTGRIAFIDKVVDQRTRTVSVRVEILNPRGRLRPGDYAAATISLPDGRDDLVFDEQLAGKWISPRHPQIVASGPGCCPLCDEELIPTSRFGYTSEPVLEQPSLLIPRSAVLMAGEHSVVYVETEPGRFEIRRVLIGPMSGDRVVVLGGLEDGEQVATAGNFLIDSQMQLAGNPSLLDPTRAIEHQAKTARKTPPPAKLAEPTPPELLSSSPATADASPQPGPTVSDNAPSDSRSETAAPGPHSSASEPRPPAPERLPRAAARSTKEVR